MSLHLATLRILIFLTLSATTLAQPIGEKLPNFPLRTLDGSPSSIHQIHQKSPNKVLMLTFWCTDCASCRFSEKILVKLLKEFKGKAQVVAISSSRKDDAESVKRYLKEHKLRLPVLLDPESKLAHHLEVKRTTTTAVLGKKGRLRYYGALAKGRQIFARDKMKSLLRGGIIGQPRGPIYG